MSIRWSSAKKERKKEKKDFGYSDLPLILIISAWTNAITISGFHCM